MTLDQLGYTALVLCLPLTLLAIFAAMRANEASRMRPAIGDVLVAWFVFGCSAPIRRLAPRR